MSNHNFRSAADADIGVKTEVSKVEVHLPTVGYGSNYDLNTKPSSLMAWIDPVARIQRSGEIDRIRQETIAIARGRQTTIDASIKILQARADAAVAAAEQNGRAALAKSLSDNVDQVAKHVAESTVKHTRELEQLVMHTNSLESKTAREAGAQVISLIASAKEHANRAAFEMLLPGLKA